MVTVTTMNHCVPDFDMDEDYSTPTSTSLTRPKKPPMAEEEIMELLWQNGQVIVQSQNQRSIKKSHIGDALIPAEQSAPVRDIRPEEESTTHIFMQEDEMASWLHYNIDDSSLDRDLYADILYPAPINTHSNTPPVSEIRSPEFRPAPTVSHGPPINPARKNEAEVTAAFQNFTHFTRPKTRIESGVPSGPNTAVRESTVVDSSETPAVAPKSRSSQHTTSAAQVSGADVGCDTTSGAMAANTSSAAGGGGGRESLTTYELTRASSSGASASASASASAEPMRKTPPMEDRKRKGREPNETEPECHSEDVEFESPDAKKQVRGTSMKKSRAAEVHNLSERRRRDRINEKMKALQELIPRCNKTDKASMLDEAIEYLKSLQMQLQMMSTGYGMVPMMFPGVQPYVTPMGMGVGMGMGMGIDMGRNRPMMPFSSVVAGSSLPTPAAAAHMGPRFPLPPYHMSHVPLPDQSRMQATTQSNPMLNLIGAQKPNEQQIPNFPDPYHQYLSLQHMQMSQAMMQQNSSKPSSTKGVENHDNGQSG